MATAALLAMLALAQGHAGAGPILGGASILNANIIMGLHDDPQGTLAEIDGRGSLLDIGKEFGLSAD